MSATRNSLFFTSLGTEILIVADENADATLAAVDLISQAEHDEQASAVLVTWSEDLATAVRAAVEERVDATRNGIRARAALEGPQSAVVLVDDRAAATAFSNAYAPEHLELHLEDPRPEDFVNAGAVFVGAHTPVSLGDYLAGSNHVLPTGGCACHSSGLGVAAFLRGVNIVEYDRSALAELADHVVALAEAEDLPAHAAAITVRFDR